MSRETCHILLDAALNRLNQAFSEELRRALRDEHLTVEAAALKLGISRQAFHNYLNGTALPRSKRLAVAVRELKLNLKIGSEQFDSSDFPELIPEAIHLPVQPTLWEALDRIQSDNLKLDVKRVGKSLRVSVTIGIPA
jgi:transcriptional regulator with XRE-family HTH domain